MKKSKVIPTISITDTAATLEEKFKEYLFITVITSDQTEVYILKERGSENIDTSNFFSIIFNNDNGKISTIFDFETITLKSIFETQFKNIAYDGLSIKELGSTIDIHWPEIDEHDDEDNQPESDEHDDEGVELHYVPGYEHDVAPIPIPKPIWEEEKIEPLKPVEDN
jgi:hypothetical protein